MTKRSAGRRISAGFGFHGLLLVGCMATAPISAHAAATEAPAANATLAQPAQASARASEAARTPARSERLLGSGESGPPAGALVLASLAVVALVAHRRLGH